MTHERLDPSVQSWGARVRRFFGRATLAMFPFVVLVYTGLIGIDFGQHWDEHLQCRLLARTAKSGVLLPGIYNYPTMSYWLAFSAFAPRLIPEWRPVPDLLQDLNTNRSLEQDTSELQKYALEDHGLFLRIRGVFLVVSSFAVIWTFLLVLVWRRSTAEAFLSAALLGLSWEFAYHARWIAPDLLMASFTCLTMLLIMGCLQEKRRWWLFAAAVGAGMATASKYQCGLLLLPLIMAAVKTRDRAAGGRGLARRLAGLMALFTVTFLLITPGAYLDTGRFIRWFIYVTSVYRNGGLAGYDIASGWPHLWRMLVYLGSDYFSPYRPFAVGVSVFVLLGMAALWRESRFQACMFLCFPIIYLGYMSTQRVLVVRNTLVMAPFLAVAAARGVAFSFVWIRQRYLRAALAMAFAVGLVANTLWLYQGGVSIPRSTPQSIVKDLARYIDGRPPRSVFATIGVRWGLEQLHFDLSKLAQRPEGAAELAFYPDDWEGFSTRPANLSHLATTWFGPFEVNWNYYINWPGFQRIVIVSKKNAAAVRLRINANAIPQPSP
jgi:hypothetical protein